MKVPEQLFSSYGQEYNSFVFALLDAVAELRKRQAVIDADDIQTIGVQLLSHYMQMAESLVLVDALRLTPEMRATYNHRLEQKSDLTDEWEEIMLEIGIYNTLQFVRLHQFEPAGFNAILRRLTTIAQRNIYTQDAEV